ncbi:ribonuclease D [Gammaproteobacteria bacterium]|nr:ribonuclease D [Gammaproteobacteria bacterium]MDC1251206.1 ribonuclease D [Gammaproteobacteria bacterium]
MFTYIDSIEDLAFLNEELLQKPYVGVDTEFRRTTKDNMRLALLQVNDDDEIYLIDSILIHDPKEHCGFLFSDSVVKIFHSCKEDIEAIYSWTAKEMVNIFDTQIANAILDGGFSIGYQGLVEQKLGILLNKSETRSNWVRRPLSDSQLKYAALDVEYLIHIYKEQKEELLQTSKLSWHNQDVERLVSITLNPLSPFAELERTITKAQEAELLGKLNKIVEGIAERERINSVLFFSKKAQKDFLRLVFIKGLDVACNEITSWRRKLIKEEILTLLR